MSEIKICSMCGMNWDGYIKCPLCKAWDQIAQLKKQLEAANRESEKLREAITVYISNGCHTGDCPHWRYSECEDTLKNEREILENTKKNGE